MIDSELPATRLAERSPVSAGFLRRRIDTFADAVRYVWGFPYGRNSDRNRWDLVLTEGCGTCSTKHALLAVLAREQGLDVDLVLPIFEMAEANTPGVGAVLNKHGLRSVPEAHCFLRWQGIIDVTMPPDNPVAEPKRCIHEETIEPDQIRDYKVMIHRVFATRWLAQLGRDDLDIEQLWRIREHCIAALSAPAHGLGTLRQHK